MNQQIMNDFFKHYYDLDEPSSFRGIKTILSDFKSSKNENLRNLLVDWLRKQPTYTTHFPAKFKFKRNQIVSTFIDHLWHADLIEIESPTENDNFRYILMIIDNLSKYGWAEPLLNKNAFTVKKAFLKVLRESKRKPMILSTDSGKEFTNRDFQNYLKWRKIKFLVMRDKRHASIVERWNRTIKNIIYKYMSYKKTARFIDILPKVIKNYNHTIHSRTKFRPIDVKKENEREVYQNLYKIRHETEKSQFKKGDKVRAFLYRDLFQKGYKPNYSKEIFYINKVLHTSPYIKYKIIDKKGNPIRGSYYKQELIKIE